jgi:UDP-N-acetylglucosamine 1-carboxyvinyltransferase
MHEALIETFTPASAAGHPSSNDVWLVEPARLEGVVELSGAKNSALRLLAASLLTPGTVELENYPESLLDARVHVAMLEALGKRCTVSPGRIVIEEERTLSSKLEYTGRAIRNNLLIWGALTARTGCAAVPLPGGCRLGERKYDLHVHLLEKLGARVWEENGLLCAEAPNGLVGCDVHLALRSTGATENGILCGCLARGRTRIWNPHIRPEILDLVDFLRELGARITVRGQESIVIDGPTEFTGGSHRVVPDNMEGLTWMIAAFVTGGDLEIRGFPTTHLEVPLIHLRESGARYFTSGDRVIARASSIYPVEISTGPYPGINSDMQPLFAVYGACARGGSRIVDLRFPGRYAYADELAKLGVRAREEGNFLAIEGGAPLHGADVDAIDLRAGAALLLAGCVATGTTRIRNAWQIERGYDHVLAKLAAVGARVHKSK